MSNNPSYRQSQQSDGWDTQSYRESYQSNQSNQANNGEQVYGSQGYTGEQAYGSNQDQGNDNSRNSYMSNRSNYQDQGNNNSRNSYMSNRSNYSQPSSGPSGQHGGNQNASFQGQSQSSFNGRQQSFNSPMQQPSLNNNQRHTFNGQQSFNNDQRQSFNNDQRQTFNGQQSFNNDQRQSFNGQQSFNNDQRQTFNGQQSFNNDQRQTFNGQQSFNNNDQRQSFNGLPPQIQQQPNNGYQQNMAAAPPKPAMSDLMDTWLPRLATLIAFVGIGMTAVVMAGGFGRVTIPAIIKNAIDPLANFSNEGNWMNAYDIDDAFGEGAQPNIFEVNDAAGVVYRESSRALEKNDSGNFRIGMLGESDEFGETEFEYRKRLTAANDRLKKRYEYTAAMAGLSVIAFVSFFTGFLFMYMRVFDLYSGSMDSVKEYGSVGSLALGTLSVLLYLCIFGGFVGQRMFDSSDRMIQLLEDQPSYQSFTHTEDYVSLKRRDDALTSDEVEVFINNIASGGEKKLSDKRNGVNAKYASEYGYTWGASQVFALITIGGGALGTAASTKGVMW